MILQLILTLEVQVLLIMMITAFEAWSLPLILYMLTDEELDNAGWILDDSGDSDGTVLTTANLP